MADRYVVAAGGNWNSTGTWSTSDGGAGGASVPTASDNVYLTANSGNLNVNATATCLDFDCAGYTGTLSGSSAQTIRGTTFRLSAGMTCSRTGTLTFNSTSGTCAITSAGQTLTASSVTLNGAGGAWELQDSLSIGGALTITAGNFDAGGNDIAASGISSSTSTARTVDISSSTLTLSGSLPINLQTTTNLTFSAVGSKVYVTSGGNLSGVYVGALNWGEIHFSARTGGGPIALNTASGATFEALYLDAPAILLLNTNITIATALALAGDSANIIAISSAYGTSITIAVSSGDSTLEWCAFSGITFSGTGSFTATNSYNLGGNAGITISPPSGGGASPEDIATAVWGAAPAVIDANIKQVNSVVIAGDGDSTPWGPA